MKPVPLSRRQQLNAHVAKPPLVANPVLADSASDVQSSAGTVVTVSIHAQPTEQLPPLPQPNSATTPAVQLYPPNPDYATAPPKEQPNPSSPPQQQQQQQQQQQRQSASKVDYATQPYPPDPAYASAPQQQQPPPEPSASPLPKQKEQQPKQQQQQPLPQSSNTATSGVQLYPPNPDYATALPQEQPQQQQQQQPAPPSKPPSPQPNQQPPTANPTNGTASPAVQPYPPDPAYSAGMSQPPPPLVQTAGPSNSASQPYPPYPTYSASTPLLYAQQSRPLSPPQQPMQQPQNMPAQSHQPYPVAAAYTQAYDAGEYPAASHAHTGSCQGSFQGSYPPSAESQPAGPQPSMLYDKLSALSEKPAAPSEKPPAPAPVNKSTANSILNCLKDSVRALTISDVAPAITLMSAAFIHHTRNRKSDRMVPYKNSKWVRHINNALFAYNAYGFAKDNGIIRHRDMDTREIAPTRDLMSPDVSNPLQDIASSLIRPGNGNVVEQFDDRWAVPRKAAEHYYNLIYHTKTGLYSASAQMLGAAAAIQALRTHYSNYGNGYQHEHSEMGLVLSEVNYLVSHKAETGYANANDTLEMVGKIALATLIKIKLDEERTYRPW